MTYRHTQPGTLALLSSVFAGLIGAHAGYRRMISDEALSRLMPCV